MITPTKESQVKIPSKPAYDEVDPREYQEFSSLLKTLSPKSTDLNEQLTMMDGDLTMVRSP